MSIPSVIKDGHLGTNSSAAVTSRGQLVVAPIEYSTTSSVEMSSINTAYNLAAPVAGKQGVITDLIVSTDRNVSGATGSNIVIYLADAVDSTTESSVILELDLLKQERAILTGLNWKYSPGKWLNAKCSDATVLITAAIYYIEKD